jgi:hypothetical protein
MVAIAEACVESMKGTEEVHVALATSERVMGKPGAATGRSELMRWGRRP